jgi:hypothetical protein
MEYSKYQLSDSKEGFIFRESRLLSIESSSIFIVSLLTDLLSTAMSWKLPCHTSAHSPLLEANKSMTAKLVGMKVITLIYYITGS